MSDACFVLISSFPKRKLCPESGTIARQVGVPTIKHHVKNVWRKEWVDQGYYFCADSSCPVVYFGQDGVCMTQDDLRTPVGVKQDSSSSLICYCFGVSKEDAIHAEVKAFVLNETKQHSCACSVRNPSGKCCLADFPKSSAFE